MKGARISMDILQQLSEEFTKRTIRTDLIGLGIDRAAKHLLTDAVNFCREILNNLIEEIDDMLAKTPSCRDGWVIHKKSERVLETSLGTINCKRRYYKNKKDGSYAYLVDSIIGMEKYERISKTLKADLCNQAVNHSYQQSSQICCDNRISKQSVMRAIKSFEFSREEELVHKEDVKVIHVQADEDHVAMQNGRRCKEVKLAVIHEPARKLGKKSYLPSKRHVFSSNESPDEFWSRLATDVDKIYGQNKGLKIYLHGDGAAWIKKGLEWLPNSKFVLDKFHALKSLKNIAPAGSEEHYMLKESLFTGQKQLFEDLCEACLECYDKNYELAEGARTYILNNWESIVIWHKKPECGGTCAEGLVSHCLSERLSMKPMGWMDLGLHKMTKLRELYCNGGIVEAEDIVSTNSDRKKHIEEVKESVKIEYINERMKRYAAQYSLPSGQYYFPKRDARYRLFKALSEAGNIF